MEFVAVTQPDAWRREIDVIIETRLLAAGFERFDGISYSFHVNDDVLGVVHIRNQELFKYPDPERAIINTRFGIIHYQLGKVLSHIEDDRPLWFWTLGRDFSLIGEFIGMFDLTESQSLAEKEKAIGNLVHLLRTSRVPFVRKHFNCLHSVIEFFETKRFQRDEAMLCTALAIAGQTGRAKERAEHISANLRTSDVNKTAWPKFSKKFDVWLEQKAPVPSLKDARADTFKAAAERCSMVAKISPAYRPTW
jgi:hypothetical protein